MSKFLQFFNNASAVMILIDRETGTIADANSAALEFYRIEPNMMIGQHASILSQLAGEEFDDAFIKLTSGKTFDTKIKLSDETIRDIRISNSLTEIDGKGFILSLIHDISEDIRNKRFREFTISVNDLVLNAKSASEIFDKICHIAVETGKFVFSTMTFVNELTGSMEPIAFAGEENGYLKILKVNTNDQTEKGKGPGGIAYHSGKYCYCNDIATDPIMLPWRDAALQRGFRSVIAIPINIDQKARYIFGIYAPEQNYFDDEEIALLERTAENISFALVNLENIQSRKKVEETEKYLKEIMQNAFVFIGLTDFDHNIIFWNQAMINFFGKEIYKRGKFELHELYTPPGLQTRAKAATTLLHEKSWTGECEFYGHTGETMDVLLTLSKHQIEGRQLISCTAIDITATKQINNQLKALVDVVENSTAYISISDAERRLSYANKAMRNILELDEQEDISHYKVDDFRLKNSSKMAEIDSYIGKNLKWTGEDILISKSGKKIPVAQVIVGRQNEDKKIISRSITAINISGIKNAQKQVNDLFNIIESTPTFVITTDLDLNLTYANPSFREAMKINLNEQIEKINLLEFIQLENGKPQNVILDAINATGRWSGENMLINRNGEKIPVWEVVLLGKNEEGNPSNVSITAIDISNTKEIEKQKNINKLKSDFVSFASHEIRTPLTAINSSAELIRLNLKRIDHERIPAIDHYLDNITSEVERLADMVNEILTLERIDSGSLRLSLKEISIENLVGSILEKFKLANKDNRKVEIGTEGIPVSILTDELYLSHVLENLISNAFKYSKGKKAPEIYLRYKKSQIEIEVLDFGIGVPKNEQSKLFTSFYRASNSNGIPGTGIGLNIAKQFVEMLGGKIYLKSEPETFTQVIVKIPKNLKTKK